MSAKIGSFEHAVQGPKCAPAGVNESGGGRSHPATPRPSEWPRTGEGRGERGWVRFRGRRLEGGGTGEVLESVARHWPPRLASGRMGRGGGGELGVVVPAGPRPPLFAHTPLTPLLLLCPLASWICGENFV